MAKLTVCILDWEGGRAFLPECLESIKNQVFKDYTIVIDSDEGKPFERWNKAIENCTTEYLALGIGEDDVAMPSWLEKAVAYLDAHSEAAFCSSLNYSIDAQGNRCSGEIVLPSGFNPNSADFKTLFYFMFKFGNFINFPACVWRMDAIKDLRFQIDEKIGGAADTLFYFQVLSKGWKMGFSTLEKLVKIRVHDQQYTQAQRGSGPIHHIEAMERASNLLPGVRTWDIHSMLTRLTSENEDRRTEQELRLKEKNASEAGLVICHEPPVNGTGILSAQLVKDRNAEFNNRITYLVIPDTSEETGSIIQNQFYKDVLILTCKPELLKSLVDKYNPVCIDFQHRNVWLTEADFLFEAPYVEKLILYLHDSTYFCHRWHLIDYRQKLCSGPEVDKCSKCVSLSRDVIVNDLSYAQELLEKAPIIVANSEWTKDNYSGVFGLKNIIVKNPVLPPLTKPGEIVYKNPIKIGYFGGFSVVKGVHILLEAARRLPDYQFVLFTDVPQEMLKTKNSIWGFPNVSVFGGYKREDMPLLVNLVDIVVVPSVVESYGLVKRELESLGVHVLATKTGGMDGSIKPDDVDELVKEIKTHTKKISDPRLWRKGI